VRASRRFLRGQLVPPIRHALHHDPLGPGAELDQYLVMRRRPQAETHRAVIAQFGAERHAVQSSLRGWRGRVHAGCAPTAAQLLAPASVPRVGADPAQW
jgi:hypothetical protein